MLFIILITFVVCIILYYYTSSNSFLLAAKPGKPKPNTPGKPKPNTPGKPKPAPGGKPKPTTGKPKPAPGKPKPAPGGKPKPTTGKPKPTTGKPKPTTGKPKPTTGKPKPATGKPNTPPPFYKPDSSGKCKKGDSLYQGKCFTPTNLSQYAKYQLIDIGPDLPMAFIRGRPVGSSVPGQVNGKPVKAVSAGSNIVAYLQGGQVAYGTVDANGNIKPVSGKERNPIVALGVAAVAAVAGYLMGQVDDPKQKELINKQIMAPFKGAGKIPNADVTALGLKPGQTYYSNGQQYNIYTGKDGNTTVGVMPCKGKCKDNVNVKQATTLKTVANPWASVGNAPAPGVTKEDMKPGAVYTAKDGKTYQVTKDGKGFEQCSSRTELRSLEYRSGNFCSGRPQPANDLVNQAIRNFQGLTLNAPQHNIVSYNNMSQANQNATMTNVRNYNSSYANYLQSVGNNQALSQDEFYRLRAQSMIDNHTRVNDIANVLDNATISHILQTQGPVGLGNLIINPHDDLTYMSTRYFGNGPLNSAQAQAVTNIANNLNTILSYDDHLNLPAHQWFTSIMTNLNNDFQQVPSLPNETASDRNVRLRDITANLLLDYLPVNQNTSPYLTFLLHPDWNPAAPGA
jgi:hypothetical protein